MQPTLVKKILTDPFTYPNAAQGGGVALEFFSTFSQLEHWGARSKASPFVGKFFSTRVVSNSFVVKDPGWRAKPVGQLEDKEGRKDACGDKHREGDGKGCNGTKGLGRGRGRLRGQGRGQGRGSGTDAGKEKGGKAEGMGHGPPGLVLNESVRPCLVCSTKQDRDSWDSLNLRKNNFEIVFSQI